jgi:hypothetical protein
MDSPTNFRIGMDGKWTLEDLYKFPHTFQQAYYFWNAIGTEHEGDIRRINLAFSLLPWQGGYSAVNFFEQLKFSVPRRDRPNVLAIHYESPGWLDLSLIIAGALALSRVVKSIAATLDQCNATYGAIYKGMQDRKLLRIRTEREALKLEKEQLEYIVSSARKLSNVLGFASVKDINDRTGNPYTTLKILMAVYRRVRQLAQYERQGKAVFPDTPPALPASSASSPKRKNATRKRLS